VAAHLAHTAVLTGQAAGGLAGGVNLMLIHQVRLEGGKKEFVNKDKESVMVMVMVARRGGEGAAGGCCSDSQLGAGSSWAHGL
jgi:hypothetical protein